MNDKVKTYHHVKLSDYAETLGRLVNDAYILEPERYEDCADWTDLHDVADANEFLLDADEAHGIDYPDPNDEPAFDRYVDFTNAAIAWVEQNIIPRAQTRAKYHETVQLNTTDAWDALGAVAACEDGVMGALGEFFDTAFDLGWLHDGLSEDEHQQRQDALQDEFDSYQRWLSEKVPTNLGMVPRYEAYSDEAYYLCSTPAR